MHVPVRPTGDAATDGKAVLAALLDGRAACVFDGVAPAANVRLAAAEGALRLSADGSFEGAEARLWRDGVVVATGRGEAGAVRFDCAVGAWGRGSTGRSRPAAAVPGSSRTPW